MSQRSAIVVGAGIAGLAMARSLALRRYKVTVMERNARAVGASIRNFGMVWPIGQNDHYYEAAINSREVWKQLSGKKVLWLNQAGSLHAACHADEWDVLREVYEYYRNERDYALLSAAEVAGISPAAEVNNITGALYSREECIVNPVDAIDQIARFLEEQMNVRVIRNTAVVRAETNAVYGADDKKYEADVVFVCSGADIESLFPDVTGGFPVTRCKLQMMRTASQEGWDIGPAFCGGLSLIHYPAFGVSPSVGRLKERYMASLPEYLRLGIHVMISQNDRGEITIGDSHEYGDTHDPFDKHTINEMILDYLETFAALKVRRIAQTWHGVYAKRTDGERYLFVKAERGVYLFNCLGGNGMTLSFGLAEKIIAGL